MARARNFQAENVSQKIKEENFVHERKKIYETKKARRNIFFVYEKREKTVRESTFLRHRQVGAVRSESRAAKNIKKNFFAFFVKKKEF